ncbi:MAG: transferase, partial [Muribaculaceae bacterium]|nr:transferase [Muribaculaceae bacterium]
PGSVIGGFTRIGDNCFIGLGARISNGLTIGDNITVAMGAVVTRDLTEPGIYHGSKLKRYPLPV